MLCMLLLEVVCISLEVSFKHIILGETGLVCAYYDMELPVHQLLHWQKAFKPYLTPLHILYERNGRLYLFSC